MPHYRIYSITHDGHVPVPPTIVECVTDQEKAQHVLNRLDVELWERARLVAILPSHLATPR